jgi:signal transduction histidine kinase
MPDPPTGSTPNERAAGKRRSRRAEPIGMRQGAALVAAAEPSPEAANAESGRRWDTLLEFIEAIGSELELRPLLTRILRHACELIGADHGTIGLVDERRGLVRTEVAHNMPADEVGAEMRIGEGLAGAVLESGRPVVLSRYGDVANPVQADLVEHAVIGVPIMGRQGVLGFFGIGLAPGEASAGGASDRRFGEEDVALLTIFARHAGNAIENAQRYGREQARTERLELISRIGRIIAEDLRLDELLERAAGAIHELLGYPNVAIPLLDPRDPQVLVLRAVGGHYRTLVRHEYRIPVACGIMGAAVREERPQLVNDVAADPRHLPTPGATGITAELAVPIRLGGRTFGVVNVESADPFTDEDTANLQIVADQLAVAIENARLYEHGQRLAVLEERQRLARELHDSVTQHIFGMVLIGESLASAWRRNPEEAARRAQRMAELSRVALAEMRNLLDELRPDRERVDDGGGPDPTGLARVRRLGLVSALERQANDMAAEDLRIEVNAAGYVPQRTIVEEALFRIGQEALSNIVKHAGARHASITLMTGSGETRLDVRDDGTGFRRVAKGRERGARTGGLGLSSMRERAEELGGRLRVESTPGRGTHIEVRIPDEGGASR